MIFIAIITIMCSYRWCLENKSLVQIECAIELAIADSEKGRLGSSSKGPVRHAKESGLDLINKGEPWMFVVFSQGPDKKPTVYRNL